jgi:hypothetical protein
VDRRIRLKISPEEIQQLNTLLPTRRNEIMKHLALYEGNAVDLIDDAQIKQVAQSVLASEVNPDLQLLDLAGKGYRKRGDQLTRGNEEGRYKLVPDKPVIYSDEEQDLGELLNLQKEYDFQMSGQRGDQKAVAEQYLAMKLAEVLDSNVTTSSRRTTGMGGVASEPARKNHPDLPEITLENTLPATNKFMLGNLFGNEIGAQSISSVNRKGDITSLPIEHTMVPFSADPSRGMDVSNRDIGSPLNNSVLRGETDTDRIAELLYGRIVDKAQYISNTYGVSPDDLMTEFKMNYKANQPRWDDSLYSGIVNY